MIIKEKDLARLASKSLINCHTIGLDSVILDDSAGQFTRAFIARSGHDLWRNNPRVKEGFSVSLHPHHCRVDLLPIYGDVFNVSMEPHSISGGDCYNFSEYTWESPIGGGSGQFKATGKFCPVEITFSHVKYGPGRLLPATEYHTIWLPNRAEAAWFVFEGEENPDYKPLSWSNVDLEQWKPDGLYVKMGELPYRQILDSIGVSIVRT